MESARFLTGQFLLATPGMGDPRFAHAVIAICSHDDTGAVGIGIGATVSGLGLHDVLEQFEIAPADAPNAPIHFGGPVETRRGFVLHSTDWSGQDTVAVAGRWALTGTVDVLRAIAAGRGPARWSVALGYAGWSGGQLEDELTGAGWLNVPGDPALIFDTPAEDRWARAYERVGVDPRLLATDIGRA